MDFQKSCETWHKKYFTGNPSWHQETICWSSIDVLWLCKVLGVKVFLTFIRSETKIYWKYIFQILGYRCHQKYFETLRNIFIFFYCYLWTIFIFSFAMFHNTTLEIIEFCTFELGFTINIDILLSIEGNAFQYHHMLKGNHITHDSSIAH